ncbi:MAG TPA: LPS export ABC transporter periplasmic protein LptC [Candidatus Binatia bacterium]|jgi:LPS export ABC transporter protein LptC|nr:LPS export ABC transporter periplasmic protein LptC [Candidatus Binatia bacterium]
MTRKSKRFILFIVIVAALGGIGYKVAEQVWVMKSREFKRNPLKALDYLPEAALQIKDFHRTHIDGDRKVWEVFGEEARYLRADKQAVIKKPRILFYSHSGQTLEATGNEAYLFFTDQEVNGQAMIDRMQITGDIQVAYDGFVFNTDELFYLKGTNQIISPGKVTLKGDGLELEGVGMEISIEDEKLRLERNVKTKLQPNRLPRRGKTS